MPPAMKALLLLEEACGLRLRGLPQGCRHLQSPLLPSEGVRKVVLLQRQLEERAPDE